MKIAFIGSNLRHGKIIRHIVRGIVQDSGHEIFTFDENEKLDEKSVFDLFKSKLQTVDIVIVDASDLSPYTSLLIGAALQLNKPFITIARSGSDMPSSVLQSGPYLTYEPSEKVEDIQRRLLEWIKRLSVDLSTAPGTATQLPIAREHKLFISYSHKDREYLDRLLIHLRPLERAGRIELWSDTQIRTGDRWKAEIRNALDRATIAVLLVSADFMASDFIINDELPPLLKSAEERGTKILPLIIKPCRFLREPSLSQFQAANLPSKAFILLNEGEQEAILDQLATEVERFVSAT